MPSNVTISGGTPQQQQVIQQAHTSALQLVQQAQAQSAQGQGAFVTWFGPANSTTQAQVANVYSQVANSLQNDSFVYDLVNQLTDQLGFSAIYLIFDTSIPPVGEAPPAVAAPATGNDSLTLDVALWSSFWNLYALNETEAQQVLTLSVVHQTIIYTVSNIQEMSGAETPDEAKELAVYDSSLALQSLRNYLYYL